MFFPKLAADFTQQYVNFNCHTSKIICVGRNYSEHAAELNNPILKEPLLFIKSTNTLVDLNTPIKLPGSAGECHHELEVTLLIGKTIDKTSNISIQQIAGIGVGLDLTLRELQSQLKLKGHPWERAKSFDGACPVSHFIAREQFEDVQNIDFAMTKNGILAQHGNTRDMLFDIKALIGEISQSFTLYPGDIVLTGTPAGVAALNSGELLEITLQNKPLLSTIVI